MILWHFQSLLKKVVRVFSLFLAIVISLILVLSAGIYITLRVVEHQGKLKTWINKTLNWDIQYQAFHIQMHSYNPDIILENMTDLIDILKGERQ